MAAPNNFSVANISTDPTHPTIALDTRVGGNIVGRPFSTTHIINNNSSGNLYFFMTPFHCATDKLDVNSAPPSSVIWGVVPPQSSIPFRVGNGLGSVVGVVGDNSNMTAIIQPEANV